MDLQYLLKDDDDYISSVPSSPRSWLGTPPSSPFPWTECSPITTPGSNGKIWLYSPNIQADRCSLPVSNNCQREQRSLSLDSIELSPSIKRNRFPRKQTPQAETDIFSNIWSRRRVFLLSIRDTLLPLLGDSIVDDFLSGADGSGIVQTRAYVLLDNQPAG
jgi:hypothetical protein